MREIKLYTILSTLSTDEKTESCGIRNVQNKQLFCEVITAIQFLRQSEKKDNCLKCSENIAWDEDLWYNLNKDRERKLLQYPNYGPEGMMIL